MAISFFPAKTRIWRHLTTAVAVSGIMLPGHQVIAQEMTGLRGGVNEDEINRTLIGREELPERPTALQRREVPEEQETGFQAPDYEPVNDGAEVGDDQRRRDGEAASIFDLNRDDPFANEPPTSNRPRRRTAATDTGDDEVVTTRQRIEAEREDRQTEPRDRLDDTLTGTVRADRIDALDEERNAAAEPTAERTGAIEGLDSGDDDDPYAPLGIRIGTFVLLPELEQGLSWSSNADSSAGGGEAVLSETTLRLNGESDWSRHAFQFGAFGTFRQTLSGADVSEISGGANALLRLDLADGFAVSAGADYQVTPETAASAVVIPGAVSQPLSHTLVGTLGVARTEGKLRVAANGRVERQIYEDADLGGGGVLSQKERNTTLATLTLRTGYEVSPALVPFIEAEIGRRTYDLRTDTAGFARSADRYAVRAGVELNLGDKLTGEFAAGWISEKPDDTRLVAVEGVSALASLAWSPMRGTTVNLDAATTIETTTQAGSSGSILYDVDLGIERQIRANLTGNLAAGFGFREFKGSNGQDLIIDIEAGLTWWLNRNFGITGRAGYENVSSNVAGRDAETLSAFLGVRLRR